MIELSVDEDDAVQALASAAATCVTACRAVAAVEKMTDETVEYMQDNVREMSDQCESVHAHDESPADDESVAAVTTALPPGMARVVLA